LRNNICQDLRGLTKPERLIMAKAVKSGQDKINLKRKEAKSKQNQGK